MRSELFSRAVPLLSGASLIAAGAIQFTRWKMMICCAAAHHLDAPFHAPNMKQVSGLAANKALLLCLLRRAHDDSTRSWNHESARDDSRRDCHCCGETSPPTCNRHAARWHFGYHRGCRVLLGSFPLAKLARLILPCFPFTLTVRRSDHENISH